MEVVVSVRSEQLLARLFRMPDAIRQALLIVMQRLAIGVQRSVKENKLTGQVLNVRTGTLRRSINQEVENRKDGIFAIVGTNVKYAAIHEYGFSGEVSVKAHARRVRKHSHISKNTGKMIKGKFTGDVAMVSAHVRNVVMPERSFLRSTLREWEPRIKEDIRQAATSVLNLS